MQQVDGIAAQIKFVFDSIFNSLWIILNSHSHHPFRCLVPPLGSHKEIRFLENNKINHKTARKVLNWNRVCIFMAKQKRKTFLVIPKSREFAQIRFRKFKLNFLRLQRKQNSERQTNKQCMAVATLKAFKTRFFRGSFRKTDYRVKRLCGHTKTHLTRSIKQPSGSVD